MAISQTGTAEKKLVTHRLDGSVLSVVDLPQKDCRWTSARKADVAQAVKDGLLSVEEACARYDLTEEELARWQQTMVQHGVAGLRVTHAQRYSGKPLKPSRSRKGA